MCVAPRPQNETKSNDTRGLDWVVRGLLTGTVHTRAGVVVVVVLVLVLICSAALLARGLGRDSGHQKMASSFKKKTSQYKAKLASLGIKLLELCLIDLIRDRRGCRPCRQKSLKPCLILDVEEVIDREIHLNEQSRRA